MRIMLSVARCASSVVCAACCASCCVSHVARRRLCARCVLRVTLLVSGHVARCTLQIMLYVACCTRLDAGLHVAGLYAARCMVRVVRCTMVLRVAPCGLHVIWFVLHVACYTVHSARRMPHVAPTKSAARLLQHVRFYVARCILRRATHRPRAGNTATPLQRTGTALVPAHPLTHRHSRLLCACWSAAAAVLGAHGRRLQQTTPAMAGAL